ncbi:MAG TPA: hypothetical protein VM557_09980 [Thermoanaerobaculia bacterium]|nr:hypothetical protein [Thermoanaerobaculia bacterium]
MDKRMITVRLILLSLFLATGCKTVILTPPPAKNILMFDEHGRPLDPTGDCGPLPCHVDYGIESTSFRNFEPAEWDQHIDDVLDSALAQKPTITENDPEPKRRILIFIHGGLNTDTSTVNRAYQNTASISATHFPIFVNWSSSLPSSYRDHLLYLSQGRFHRSRYLLAAPFKLASDLFRSLLRIPENMINATSDRLATSPRSPRDVQIARLLGEPDMNCLQEPQSAIRQEIQDEASFDDGFSVSFGCDCRLPEQHSMTSVADALSWGLNTLRNYIGTPVVDLGGTNTWHTLLRRTAVLYHPEPVRRGGKAVGGGLGDFLQELLTRIEDGEAADWEITIVGHSMGAIVLNEMLRHVQEFYQQPDYEKRTPPVRNIVYMAAACSLRDYHDTVVPYLSRNPSARMYHLTLHPISDLSEQSQRIAPMGSLLVWIDRFLSNPTSAQDWTAGRFNNLTFTLRGDETPRHIRDRIHVRVFRAGFQYAETDPQKHGDFTCMPFWRPSFWIGTAPACEMSLADARLKVGSLRGKTPCESAREALIEELEAKRGAAQQNSEKRRARKF